MHLHVRPAEIGEGTRIVTFTWIVKSTRCPIRRQGHVFKRYHWNKSIWLHEILQHVQTLLEKAVAVEDGMGYMEPPRQYQPVRHCLGRVLLSAGRPAEAEQVACFPPLREVLPAQ